MNANRQWRADRWQTLQDLAGEVDPDAALEFAPGVDEPPTVGRRDLTKLLGASLLLASACTRAPRGKIVTYGHEPEDTPGVARTYATTLTFGGYGTGVLAQTHEGRPTKLEGNPDHPASLGAAGVYEQASLLSLYDPNRLPGVREGNEARSFEAFAKAFRPRAPGTLEGTHLLLGPTTSPHLEAQVLYLEARGATAHVYDPLSRSNVWEGTANALGQPAEPIVDLTRADVVVALDADLLAKGPDHLRHARGYAGRRRVTNGSPDPSRLYVVEPALTVTGSVADQRLRARRLDVPRVAGALLRAVLDGTNGLAWSQAVKAVVDDLRVPDDVATWAHAVAKDLLAHRGRAVVVAGETQPAVVHAWVALLNHALGSVGTAVRYVRPAVFRPGPSGLPALLAAIDRGAVDTLLIVGGNPSYDAPAELDFGRRIRAVKRSAYLTSYENETAKDVHWLVPAAHDLESWSDARSLDGTLSLVQPVLEPLYGGKTRAEFLTALTSDGYDDAKTILETYWQKQLSSFATAWPEALRSGVVPGTAFADLAFDDRRIGTASPLTLPSAPVGLEIVFQPDGRAGDGGYANNAWILELPDPITKQTWGNAACLSVATAARLGVTTEDVVTLSFAGRTVQAPVLIVPGHAEDSVSVALGFGREGSEELARGVGFSAGKVRPSDAFWAGAGLALVKTGDTTTLAITQEHASMEGRPIARAATLASFRRDPQQFAEQNTVSPTLYHLQTAGKQQWAMAIDLNVCTGCSACVVACQAENNVPVVGKAGVEKGRAMHWLRLDRYFEGEAADPRVHHQPMACQHCEKAPCEYVCPVGATVHGPDGLNEMVYNRCVGTRFCSNNCPYKVRRFNWFDYNRDKPETIRMAMNPDVTVRARGVMEKCSYCVQRIRETEITSHTTGVPRRDGDVRTACEQACPTQAITFGSIADPSSRVSTLRRDLRTYAVLHEVGTEPRTRYLARITNPNPELPT